MAEIVIETTGHEVKGNPPKVELTQREKVEIKKALEKEQDAKV